MSTISKAPTLMETFDGYLKSSIDDATKRIVSEHKEQIEKEIEEARQDIVAKFALRMSRMVDYQHGNDRLVITIHDSRGSHP